MQVARSVEELTKALEPRGASTALIMTRGFLHEGQEALVRIAHRDGLRVVLGIFLDERQFPPGEKVSLYPRDPERDLHRAEAQDVEILWLPRESEVFPPGFATEVRLPPLERALGSIVHPEVLRAQVTASVRAINLALASCIYFGELDWHKAICLHHVLRDLALGVQVQVVPTAREEDGLAFSSLNVNLHPEERRQAPLIYAALREAQRLFCDEGEVEVTRLVGRTSAALTRIVGFRLQYVQLVDPQTLREGTKAHSGDVLMAGGFFGRTRIADAVRLP